MQIDVNYVCFKSPPMPRGPICPYWGRWGLSLIGRCKSVINNNCMCMHIHIHHERKPVLYTGYKRGHRISAEYRYITR